MEKPPKITRAITTTYIIHHSVKQINYYLYFEHALNRLLVILTCQSYYFICIHVTKGLLN